MKPIYITDCEGPITKNDNAFELTSHFIPDGDRLFSILSRYDDLLAYVYKRRGYRAGNTLKLIAPFLKAYGVTNEMIMAFSRESVLMVPGAAHFLLWASINMPTFLISTSYTPYVHVLCDILGFPREQTTSTALDLNRYRLHDAQVKFVKDAAQKILRLPALCEATNQLTPDTHHTVTQLDRLFERLAKGDSGRILRHVRPIGGSAKARQIRSIIERLGGSFDQVIYVGDSITDVHAFRLVRKEGGLAISFNGNRYAVEEAEIAVISQTAETLKRVVSAFLKDGRAAAVRSVRPWNSSSRSQVLLITPQTVDAISERSAKMRRELRGERVGALG